MFRYRLCFLRLASLLVLVAAVTSIYAEALPPPLRYNTRTWLAEDGLPHNTINTMVQDKRGFLWLASAGGLARFDGHGFKELPLPMASASSGFNIRDLKIEPDGGLVLLPASGGIVRCAQNAFSFHPANSALKESARGLFVEADGALWVETLSTKVMRWQAGRTWNFDLAKEVNHRDSRITFACDREGRVWLGGGEFLGVYRDGQITRFVERLGSSIAIASARSGGIWIASSVGLLKWDNDRFTTVLASPDWPGPRVDVQELFEDSQGTLWIVVRHEGLFRFAKGTLSRVPEVQPMILSVMEDSEGDIWVCTAGHGVSRLRPKTFTVLNAAAGLPQDESTSMCDDASGALWCANRSGGVVRWKQGHLDRIAPPTRRLTYASNLCPDAQGRIWVGGVNGLYVINNDGSPAVEQTLGGLRAIHALFAAKNGDVWVGSEGVQLGYFHSGQYRAFTAADGFPEKRVSAIDEDFRGAIWVATDDGDLFEVKNEKFEQKLSGNDPLGARIHALHIDARGAVWLATANGLVVKDGEHLTRFSHLNGLPDDIINQILEDDSGRMWCSSRRGFFNVPIEELRRANSSPGKKLTVTTFGKDEGLPGMTSLAGGQPMAWKSRDGRLWFATAKGLVGFDSASSMPPLPAPRVYVDELLVDDHSVSIAEGLKFPSKIAKVEFRFVALSYASPEKVRIRHRLVGFDSNWVETGSGDSASYSRLPPGGYTLRVIACNQDGLWTENPLSLAFVVVPAWWQTWWFSLSAFVFFTASVVWAARYWSHRKLLDRLQELERENALERERARIARDLHDELGGSLTKIGLLSERLRRHAIDSPLAAPLAQLASRTRRLATDLESIVWTVSPKNNTWDALAAFITQHAQRFFRDTPIECTVQGGENIGRIPISPETQHHVLAVSKEALNNVLKHSQATSVHLRFEATSKVFVLIIQDDGQGFDPTAPEHAERNGLSNMRTRMREIGGEVVFESKPDRGTIIRLRVSLFAKNLESGAPLSPQTHS